MKFSVPSNGNITPPARKSSARIFHSAPRPAVLAEGAASTQIPLAEKMLHAGENYELSPWFRESKLRAEPRAAHARRLPVID